MDDTEESSAMHDYIHGYAESETARLTDQATTLAELLHHDTFFPPNSRVLEAGCGTGAQTVFLAQSSPGAMIEGIRDKALDTGMIDESVFDAGIRDLYRTAEADGVFCYTFFKAFAQA
jgi:trans-aconitate methyltransferase